jgi:hypothetical protein
LHSTSTGTADTEKPNSENDENSLENERQNEKEKKKLSDG